MFKEFSSDWFHKCFGNVKSMAIVGNAPSIKDYNYGEIIDSYDLVCRFNRYEIHQYERYVGRRTDLFVTNLLTSVPEEKLRNDGVKGILISRPLSRKHVYNVALGIMLTNFQAIRNMNISFLNEDDFELLYVKLGIPMDDETGRNPTSGIAVLYAILKHLRMDNILLIGFNFFDMERSRIDGLHYFSKDLHRKLDELHKYHPQEMEEKMFKELVEANPQIVITRDEALLLGIKTTTILEDIAEL